MWALKTYYKKRREYPQLFTQPEYVHLRNLHLRSPVAIANWLHKNFAAYTNSNNLCGISIYSRGQA
ncbi:hypothetical protein FDUTEX481_09966 [Tolypothrix sp. PCC 7601]|nr:hypothetical protein FDUTEX481_09966 [Tolypothrix sp. PCC 7601]